MKFLLPTFIVMPIIEMLLLIQVGSLMGALPTVGLVLLTAMIGLHLLRQQGISTLMRANERLASGQIPAEEVVEGLMLAVGGALLLTPGFFTDAIGFACLIPQTRHFFAKKLIAKGILKGANISGLGNAGQHGGFYQQSGFDFDRGPKHHQSSADDIEGESSPVNDDQLLK